MEYIAAFSLVTLNSNETVAKDALRPKIIELMNSIQATICEESLDLFLSAVDGKTPSEILVAGSELMKSQIASAPASGASSAPSQTSESRAPAVVEESSESAELDFF